MIPVRTMKKIHLILSLMIVLFISVACIGCSSDLMIEESKNASITANSTENSQVSKVSEDSLQDDESGGNNTMDDSEISVENISEASSDYEESNENSIMDHSEVSEDDMLLTLSVNGSEFGTITARHVSENRIDADLPVVAILKGLGASIDWKSDTVAEIFLNGVEYCLDIEACELTTDGENLLLCAPGGTLQFQSQNHELIVNDTTLSYLFLTIDVSMQITESNVIIDYNN